MSEPSVTLYRLHGCPYCERVVTRLEEYGVEYRSVFAEPMHSDRNIVKRVSGSRTVPVLVDEETGVMMSESDHVVEYVDRRYGDGSTTSGTETKPEFTVTDLPDGDHPTEGQQAPDFVRPLVSPEGWEDTALSTLTQDRPVLLVFHPMDGSPRTTYMYDEIQSRGWDQNDGYHVVGVSTSTPYEHSAFIEDGDVDVRLFSDPSNGVAERYGVVNDRIGMAGLSEPRPAVFVIDEDRVVRYADAATQWPDPPDYEGLGDALTEVHRQERT
jgi:peroxiredoxin/glutaredoxin